MTQEAVRWKLFPFSLTVRAEQWYTRTIGSMCGDLEELRADFCHSFSLTKRLNSLPIDILNFEQLEKESIGAAWARFSNFLASSPDWSIPDDICLHIFYTGLDMDSACDLDIAAGGSFMHRTPIEGREILDHILGNSSFVAYPCEPQQESQSHLESPSSAEFYPCSSQDSSVEPSPEPRTSKEEEIQPSKFSFQF